MAAAERGVADVQAVLDQALDLAAHCSQAYAGASAATRRQWNQAFFEKLLVDADEIADDERAAPFDDLTDPTLATRLKNHCRRLPSQGGRPAGTRGRIGLPGPPFLAALAKSAF